MKRVLNFVVIVGLASQALVIGQGQDAARVLALVRGALGGEKKLSEVKTLAATGRSTKVNGDTSSAATDYEMAMELPDKFMKKEVLAMFGSSVIARTSGFNDGAVIDSVDRPPMMGGGQMIIRTTGPGTAPAGATPTPEQEEAARRNQLQAAHEEFARLSLGMFAQSFPAFPLEFSYIGQAESPDGKADVIGVAGADNFAAKLFVDSQSHLPLMLSWMAKEPLVMSGGPARSGGGGSTVVQFGGGGGASQQMTPEQRDQMLKDMEERMKEAQARLRTVEYRVYYGDYQDVSGVKLPFKLQRSIDGKPTEEIAFDKIKINGKIDPKKFEVSK